jgi:hypothetical protein
MKMKNIIQGRDFGKTIEIVHRIDAQDSDSIEDGLAVRIAPPTENSNKKESKSAASQNASNQQTATQSKESCAPTSVLRAVATP